MAVSSALRTCLIVAALVSIALPTGVLQLSTLETNPGGNGPAGALLTPAAPVSLPSPALPSAEKGGMLAIPGPAASPARAAPHPALTGVTVGWFNVTNTASRLPNERPPYMLGSSLVYDPGGPHIPPPTAGLLVLFGGFARWGAPTNYTYVGIPTTVTAGNGVSTPSVEWVNLSSRLPTAPAPRYHAAMAYDATDNYVVLFGGSKDGVTEYGDTWTFQVTGVVQNGNWTFYTSGWTRLIERATPSLRSGARMAYDSIDHYVVLYGGSYNGTPLGDTWIFAGGTWTPLHPIPSPLADSDGALVPDGPAGLLLIFGQGESTLAWTFLGGTWTFVTNSVPLGPRAFIAVSYDNATGNLTVFGGQNQTTLTYTNDTWNATANLSAWWQPTTSQAPAERGTTAMAYDPAIGLTVLFGGGGNGGTYFNDTWLFGTWPPGETPFSVTLTFGPASLRPGPPFPPPARIPFIATPNGGSAPYNFQFVDGGLKVNATANGSVLEFFLYTTPGNYLLSVTATSGALQASANLTVPVGSVMVPNWQPLRDFYSFSNYGSGWSPGGNCYGFATTAALYWEHDIAGAPVTPYLPAHKYSTFDLVAPPGIKPFPGPGMNSTTLAIMLHQTLDPANSVNSSFSPSDMVASYTLLVKQLQKGNPVVLSLAATNRSIGYHAVVAYGEWSALNGTDEITTSDSNEPGKTNIGYWDPTNETFTYTSAGIPVNGFIVALPAPAVSTLQPSWLGNWAYDGFSQSYDTQGFGFEVVGSDVPLSISSSAGGSDFFALPTEADSQTFVGGIAGSSGVEEPFLTGTSNGTVQAYALPMAPNVTYSVNDPSSGSSHLMVVQATNDSGIPLVQGFSINVTSTAVHDFTLVAGPNGTRMSVGSTPVNVTISFARLVGNVSDVLNASSLDFPAFSQVTFDVRNWSALASTSTPSVTVYVAAHNGTGPTTEYSLENGQAGLGGGSRLTFVVAFTETGLPALTLARAGWTVILNGTRVWSTHSTISFSGTPNGTFPVLVTGPMGYRVSTSIETVSVAGNASVDVPFVKGSTYTLTFSEKELARGQTWCVTLNGAESCTSRTSQRFGNLSSSASYGAYAYAIVSPLGGQRITASIGRTSVPVSGSTSLSRSETIVYTIVYDYAVTFTESGAPAGTWSITVAGHTLSNATGEPITFELRNGTYSYRIGAIAGFRSAGYPRPVRVSEPGVTVTVTFSPKSPGPGTPVSWLGPPHAQATAARAIRRVP